MVDRNRVLISSPLGQREADGEGSPIGVVRLDPERSYAGVGTLLQTYINQRDQQAWESIKAKIDYTYESLDLALAPLDAETGFAAQVKARVEGGQKLLFKPNLVSIGSIDPQTHGPTAASTTCTEWPLVAALMRWFHDKLGIGYHQMCIGEAATSMSAMAGAFSILNPSGQPVTTEAVIEGRTGDFYGGWGFYFVRQYLSETHNPFHADDPFKGYEESIAGTHVPPGLVSDKLMVYDLNRIYDDPCKGRAVGVPDGVNFQSITLHKAIVGGDPNDPADRKAYPGCVLVNVPKFKVHIIALFTNVIKNLGIGLYPMQSTKGGQFEWEYSVPETAIPGIKGRIPHQVWVSDVDPQTGLPKKDATGSCLARKTGGIQATMADIIKAVSSQDTFMIHVVDGIEAINLDHQGSLPGIREPEGLVFAGLDPVATDLLCARYMFSNVPLAEALQVGLDDGNGGHFPQRVPIPTVEKGNIVSRPGYDCPLARDVTFAYAEQRGLGRRQYYVVGRDTVRDLALVSLTGHLGVVDGGVFSDLVTNAMYFDVFKMPWDLQQTVFRYLEIVDELTGSSLKQDFLTAFDENGDGIVGYEEFGRTGITDALLGLFGLSNSLVGNGLAGALHGSFVATAAMLKWSDASWNPSGETLFRDFLVGANCLAAYRMSQSEVESPDPFLPTLTWGKGKWPSFQFASYLRLGVQLYGAGFPATIDCWGLFGSAFRYADLTQNDGLYAGPIRSQPDPEAISRYMTKVADGEAKPLDFTLYVPPGFGSVAGKKVPNVEETIDPAKVFTASFSGGAEVWPAVTL